MPRLMPNGNIATISHIEDTERSIYAGIRIEIKPSDPEYEHYLAWLTDEEELRARELLAAAGGGNQSAKMAG